MFLLRKQLCIERTENLFSLLQERLTAIMSHEKFIWIIMWHNNGCGFHFSHQACGSMMEIKADPILWKVAALLRTIIESHLNYILFLKERKKGERHLMTKMFPTVGNCFAFSQKNKGKNEKLNYVWDDVRIGDQLCLLMASLSYP